MKNKHNGFIQTIIIIAVALLLMRYYGVSVEDALNWIKSIAYSVWDFLKNF